MIEAHAGRTPLVLSLPHVGSQIPAELQGRLTPLALEVADTDWHVEQLYAFARPLGCGWLQPSLSRYVIDLNRPADDAALYPGQVSTGLCPTMSFDGAPLYRATGPTPAEVAERRSRYWQPYHDALQSLLAAARARHGFAVLLDAHSIRSAVPRLFAGRLPDVNLGTNAGASCAPALSAAVLRCLQGQSVFSSVLDGRFKGGYITRHYGDPQSNVHALQVELSQASYMDESGHSFDAVRAAPLIALLGTVVQALLEFKPA